MSAPSAEIGLELAKFHLPDLILMDINLPGMDGNQALARLKEIEETNSIPVVALSANALPKDIKRAKKAGFQEYLTKPIDIEKLMEVLNHSLEQLPNHQNRPAIGN